jgi:nucleoside diphosphate kinase
MSWLTDLKTETPEAGFELAIKLSRMAVKLTQPDDAARNKMRPDYANDADSLIAVSQVVAVNFQTVSQANDFWRSKA